MEGLSRLVTESLVRHGLDRPLDYRRLRWSRWFRCESHHSLLQVPSKPGVFALAEEIAQLSSNREGRDVSRAENAGGNAAAFTLERPEPDSTRRMLAVTHFFEDDDMAFVLDRMLTRQNPLRASLNSGRYFIRFVAIEDRFQRRSIHTALNQWLTSSSEKASGIGTHFAASLDLTANDVARAPSLAPAGKLQSLSGTEQTKVGTTLPCDDSGTEANLHCPQSLPSGF